MAMVVCGECGTQISSLATSCPKCGCPMSGGGTGVATAAAPPPVPKMAAPIGDTRRKIRPVGIALVALLIGAGLWAVTVFVPTVKEHVKNDPLPFNTTIDVPAGHAMEWTL